MMVAAGSAAARNLSWKEEAGSLALKNGDHVVWQFNATLGEMKPVFHPIARLDGTVLTDFRPADHLWHRSGWFSFRYIDGVNYWEEDANSGLAQGRTNVTEVQFTPHDDFSATIELALEYYPVGEKAILREKRLIKVSKPDASGDYAIDWQTQFRAVDAVTLQPDAGYAGLSLRLQPALRGWKFINSEGKEAAAVHGDPCKWLSFEGEINDGKSALTIFDHPSNLTFPTPSFIVQHMPYMSPAFLFKKEIKIEKSSPLELMYRIKVHDRAPKSNEIEKEFGQFAKLPFEIKHELRINLVELGHKVYAENCEACHANSENFSGLKTGPSWWALMGVKPNTRKVMVEGGIKEMLIDDEYIRRSILSPNIELALYDDGEQKGKPYLPIMPSYGEILSQQEIDGVIAYLKTLNNGPNRGPDEVFAVDEAIVKPTSDDPNIISIGENPKVQRVIINGFSPRSFGVGLPSGFSYVFDPESCSIRHAWKGGFLNLSGERTARGTAANNLYRAKSIGFSPFLQPQGNVKYLGYRIGKNQVEIDLSIDGEVITQSVIFSNQGMEIILSRAQAGKSLQFEFNTEKVKKSEVEHGEITGNQLIIPPNATDATLRVEFPEEVARKSGYRRVELARAFSFGNRDGGASGPDAAIDGDFSTYWDEADGLQEYSLRLGLEKRERFSLLRIYGHRHHDFAPKDFSIFVDGNLVKTVENAQYQDNVLEVDFPAQTGWNVELRITGSHGGSPAIRELEVFQRIEN